jgi:hypothetical protein
LPVIGSTMSTFSNGNVGGVLSSYGGAVPLNGEMWIE